MDTQTYFYAYGPKSGFDDAYTTVQAMLYGIGQSGWLTYEGEFFNFNLRHRLVIKLPEGDAALWMSLQ